MTESGGSKDISFQSEDAEDGGQKDCQESTHSSNPDSVSDATRDPSTSPESDTVKNRHLPCHASSWKRSHLEHLKITIDENKYYSSDPQDIVRLLIRHKPGTDREIWEKQVWELNGNIKTIARAMEEALAYGPSMDCSFDDLTIGKGIIDMLATRSDVWDITRNLEHHSKMKSFKKVFEASGKEFAERLIHCIYLKDKDETVSENMYQHLFISFLRLFNLRCHFAPSLQVELLNLSSQLIQVCPDVAIKWLKFHHPEERTKTEPVIDWKLLLLCERMDSPEYDSDDWNSGSDIDDKKKNPDFDIRIHTTGACADDASNEKSTRVHPLVQHTRRSSINPKPVVGLPEQMSNVQLQNGNGDATYLQNPTYFTCRNRLNESIIPQNILLTTFSVCEVDIKPEDNIGKTHDEVSNENTGYDTEEKIRKDGSPIPSNSGNQTSTVSLNREGTNKYGTALSNNIRSKTLHTLSHSATSQQNVDTRSININYPRKDRTPVNYVNSEKKYKCRLCDKSYISSSHLKVHFERIHLDHRPHKCKTCGKSFYSEWYLKSHSATHNAPSFKCHICGFASAREKSIKLHIKVVHEKEKNEQCDVCGKFFFSKYF